MQGAISSDECDIVSQALDQAWEIFLKTQRLDRRNHDIARPTLLYGILEALKDGERNVRRLAMRAVASFDKLEPVVRHHRSWAVDDQKLAG